MKTPLLKCKGILSIQKYFLLTAIAEDENGEDPDIPNIVVKFR